MAAGPWPGTAPAASGGSTRPPRLEHALLARGPRGQLLARRAPPPITPMNGAPGMRTPGSCAEVAQPSAICQCTRNGSVMRSRRKPSPGMMRGEGVGLRRDVDELDLEQIARAGALHEHRAGERMHRARVDRGEVAVGGDRGASWPSSASRVSSAISSPSSDLDDRRDVGVPAVVAGLGLRRRAACSGRSRRSSWDSPQASAARNARQRSSACAKPGPRSMSGRSRARRARSSWVAVLSTSRVASSTTTP